MTATTLLLVPGALNGAWIWADTFQPFFAARGYAVQSLTLPANQLGFVARQRI